MKAEQRRVEEARQGGMNRPVAVQPPRLRVFEQNQARDDQGPHSSLGRVFGGLEFENGGQVRHLDSGPGEVRLDRRAECAGQVVGGLGEGPTGGRPVGTGEGFYFDQRRGDLLQAGNEMPALPIGEEVGGEGGPTCKASTRQCAQEPSADDRRLGVSSITRWIWNGTMDTGGASTALAHRLYRVKGAAEISRYEPDPGAPSQSTRETGVSSDAPILDVGGGVSELMESVRRGQAGRVRFLHGDFMALAPCL